MGSASDLSAAISLARRTPFALAETAKRFQDEGIPPPTEAENDPGRELVIRALQPAANDSLSDLVIVGWARGALDLVLGDPYLSAKQTIWIVDTGQLPYLARALAERDGTSIKIVVCDWREQVPFTLEQLPLCWSFAALDVRLGEPHEILHQAWYRFMRRNQGPERLFGDLRHLLARKDRLAQAIPLSCWKGAYAGETALCLAAGPSLDRRLDLIRLVQDRCVVIAVDVIQARVQAAGIKVDFVLNVDSCDRIPRMMLPSPDPETVLVLPLVSHRELDGKCARRTFYGSESYAEWLLGPDCCYNTGTSVGIATVGFAQHLGCSTIVLLGHDLAFGTEAYYSDLVDRASHEASQVASSQGRMRQVPGNGDGLVATNINFEVAIHDLGMLLQRGGETVSVFSPNVNDRIGARIPGVAALPDGWRPARVTSLPRPRADATLADRGINARMRVLPERLLAQARALAGWWQERRRARPEEFSHLQVPEDPDLQFALTFLAQFERGPTYHMVKLQALPPSITIADHQQELEDFAGQAVEAGIGYLGRCLDPSDPVLEFPLERLRETGLTAEQFEELFGRIVLEPETSMDEVLVPAVTVNYLNLRRALPEQGLPAPHSANEGLNIAQALGLAVPRRFLVQTLCLCALESESFFAPCLDWGRKFGFLPAADLWSVPDTNQAEREPWLHATAAVLRLRHDASTDFTADAQAALAWHPCRLHLLRALVALKPAGIPVLETLIAAGRLPIDDQLGAILLVNHPDSARAAELISPFIASLGEATTLAIAHRECDRRNYAGALKQTDGIRVLSRFRDQALMITCRCYQALGQTRLIGQTAAQITDPQLRAPWRQFLPEVGISP